MLDGVDAPHLAGFLAGFLHQDWDVEFESWVEAARAFRLTASQDGVAAVCDELGAALAGFSSDIAADSWLLSIGCYYRPEGGSTLQWMARLREVLSTAS